MQKTLEGLPEVRDAQVPESDAKRRSPVVLVVEDNKDLCDVLEAQLRFFGFTPICVESGDDALEWLDQRRADLVVLDVMLPGTDGIKVCARIRVTHSASELPILMLSALGSHTNNRVEGLKAGANDFLAKPYNVDELVARMRVLLSVKAEKQRSEAILSRYAPMAREIDRLGPDARTRRQVRHAVILFADLRGFTRLSTRIDLSSLTDLLDEFFGGMMRIVSLHNGLTLDLTGDELLAGFNIPTDVPEASELAVRAAVRMQELFPRLQSRWAGTGCKLGLGIGIHQGNVMVGNVGGEALTRYTVMGSVVNIAHRLVEMAHEGEVVMSSEVFGQAHLPVRELEFTRLISARVKGIRRPLSLYKLCIPVSGTD